MRCQPSIITNSKSLQGKETSMGGIIIMPMDMRMEATTISMMMKGIR